MGDFAWNDQSEADLTRLWSDEHRSSAMCAAELMRLHGGRLTRSAIAGKCKRLGIQRGERTGISRQRASRAPRPTGHDIARRMASRRRVAVPAASRAAAPPPMPGEPRRIALLALEPHHCRWPLGDPRSPDFACCGVDRVMVTIKGKPEPDPTCFYCAFHQHQGRAKSCPTQPKHQPVKPQRLRSQQSMW